MTMKQSQIRPLPMSHWHGIGESTAGCGMGWNLDEFAILPRADLVIILFSQAGFDEEVDGVVGISEEMPESSPAVSAGHSVNDRDNLCRVDPTNPAAWLHGNGHRSSV